MIINQTIAITFSRSSSLIRISHLTLFPPLVAINYCKNLKRIALFKENLN